jgi:Rad51
MLTGTDEHVALELVTKAKKALVDCGLLYKDFSTAQDILDRRKDLLRCTTGSAKLDSFLKGGIETQVITGLLVMYSLIIFLCRMTFSKSIGYTPRHPGWLNIRYIAVPTFYDLDFCLRWYAYNVAFVVKLDIFRIE